MSTAVDVGFDPHVGMRAVLVGAAATIVGGRNSFAGAIIAGLLFGVIRAEVVWFTSSRWEEAATFVLLAVSLFLMPRGLKGLVSDRARLEEQA
jgi:branched-subunit amino acid ABC-type transport system permease component